MKVKKAKSVLALGLYVANLDQNLSPEEHELLLKYVGRVFYNKNYAIESDNSFKDICDKYLDKLSRQDLSDISRKIAEIIRADGVVSSEEATFLKKEWLPYLEKRCSSNPTDTEHHYLVDLSENREIKDAVTEIYEMENQTPSKVNKWNDLSNVFKSRIDKLYEEFLEENKDEIAIPKTFEELRKRHLERQKKERKIEWKPSKSDELIRIEALLSETNWETVEATSNLKKTEATGNLKKLVGTATPVLEKETIQAGIHQAELVQRLADDLSKLNTMRGGTTGFKGFVAEHLQAAKASTAGKNTSVLNNNGIADLAYKGKNGHVYNQQMKMGYKPGQIDFAKYKGQKVVIDKGNPYLKEFQAEGRKYGVKVVEGDVTNQEAKNLADMMQKETRVTGEKTSTVVTTGVKTKGVLKAAHETGLNTAKSGALFGAGVSLGANMMDVLTGDKSAGEAAEDIAVDTAVSGAVGYGVGAAGSIIGSTSYGAAAIETAGTVGSAIAGTTLGGTVVGAATATGTAVAGIGTAAASTVVGGVGAVGSAIGGVAVSATAGTAIGGAVATGVGAATAGAAAVGAAAVAAAPIVAVGAAIGVGVKLISWLFDD